MEVHSASLFLLEAKTNTGLTSSQFEDCPVMWNTEVSYGLAQFLRNFIDYEEVCLPLQDIAHTNFVLGIGTVMWKLSASNGDLIYLLILCYNLPTVDI